MIQLLFPEDKRVISIQTSILRKFDEMERSGKNSAGESAYSWMGDPDNNIQCGRILNAPTSIFFKWKCDDPSSKMDFEISLDPEFKSQGTAYGNCASVGEAIPSCEGDGVYCLRVENLYSGKRYYWRVKDSDGNFQTRSFDTVKNEYRMIRADEICNIRDVGTWQTSSGKRIKQGMIYRGPAIRDKFSMNMWRVFVKDLGIKTEIDLRYDVVGVEFDTMLGPTINYLQIPMLEYGDVYNDFAPENIRRIFALLSDPETYPVYVHCAAGADRTGTVIFLILAALGVSDDDIIYEYNLTSTSCDWVNFNRPLINNMLKKMEMRYPTASSLGDKLRACLKELGVTDQTVEKLKDLLLE